MFDFGVPYLISKIKTFLKNFITGVGKLQPRGHLMWPGKLKNKILITHIVLFSL